jgi:hypothetical protein
MARIEEFSAAMSRTENRKNEPKKAKRKSGCREIIPGACTSEMACAQRGWDGEPWGLGRNCVRPEPWADHPPYGEKALSLRRA